MNHQCIIIEDQLPAQRILKRYIEDVSELELSGTFTDPLLAIQFLNQTHVDLLFLDIHLPKLSGIELLKILPYKPRVILTTAFSEYALESYELGVVDYLLKPISFDRFVKAVFRALHHPETGQANDFKTENEISTSKRKYLFLKSGHTLVRIELDKIIYIKAEDDFTRIITEKKNHLLSYTMKYWLELLPSMDFSRIHKSYIVNLRHIEKIEGNEVFIHGERLPIGRSFRESLMNQIQL